MADASKYSIQTELAQIIEEVQNGGLVIGINKSEQQSVSKSTSAEALTEMAEILSSLSTLTKILLEDIEKNHPNATEAQAETIIKAEFTKLDKAGELNTIRTQLLKSERWVKGGKAALFEVAKHYVEGNVFYKTAIAFLESFSEKVND